MIFIKLIFIDLNSFKIKSDLIKHKTNVTVCYVAVYIYFVVFFMDSQNKLKKCIK